MIEFIGIADIEKTLLLNFKKYTFLSKRFDRKVKHAEDKVVKRSTLADLDKYTKQYQNLLSLREQQRIVNNKLNKTSTFILIIAAFKQIIIDFESLDLYNDITKELIYKITINDDYDNIILQLVDENYQSMPAGFNIFGISTNDYTNKTCLNVVCYNNNQTIKLSRFLDVGVSKYFEKKDFVKQLQVLFDDYTKKYQLTKQGEENDSEDTVDSVSDSETDSSDIHQ